MLWRTNICFRFLGLVTFFPLYGNPLTYLSDEFTVITSLICVCDAFFLFFDRFCALCYLNKEVLSFSDRRASGKPSWSHTQLRSYVIVAADGL